MRITFQLLAAAAALCALTTGASAAVDYTKLTNTTSNGTVVWNFDGVENSAYSYTGDVFTGSYPGVVSQPAADNSNFGAAEPYPINPSDPYASAVFSVLGNNKFTSFNIYLGSVDYWNTISFYNGNTLVASFNGDQLDGCTGTQCAGIGTSNSGLLGVSSTGQIDNYVADFTFTGATDVNRVVFNTGYPAFEFDNIATTISAVPEPATWAMMLTGFGLIGFMLRNRRRPGSAVASA